MIELKLTFASIEEAATVMSRMAGFVDVVVDTALARPIEDEVLDEDVAAVAAAAEPEKPKTRKPRAAKPEAEPEAVVEPAPVAEPKAETFANEDEAKTYLVGTVRPALVAIVSKHGPNEGKKAVVDFGFENLKDIPSGRYVEALGFFTKRLQDLDVAKVN